MILKHRKPLIMVTLGIIVAISTISAQIGFAAGSDTSVSLCEECRETPLPFAEIYADQFRVTVDEALRRLELQDVTGELDAELSNKEASTFAGLWIEHTPEFKVVVLFTRNVEETIKPYLQEYEKLVDIIEVRTAKVSLIYLQNVQEEVSSALWSLGIPMASEINVYENRVKVYVIDRTLVDNAIFDGKLRVPDCVDIITVEALGELETDIYGGLSLTTCTSGYAVKTAGGTKGITTAGHCSDAQAYGGHNLSFQSEKYETYYDIQWHTAPDFTVTNKVRYSDGGDTFSVTATKSRSEQSIGDWVAKYGKCSGFTAGLISSKTYQPGFEGAAATFIRVDNTAGYDDLSCNGDSGAPWFYWGVAWGSHCGSPTGDSNDAYYMAINYVSGIGVSVMTSP